MNRRAAVVSAFIKNGKGGNLAGVVFDAEKISVADRRAAAKTLGFSETVFVETLPGGAFQLRYFTPAAEVDLCGHATVAAFGFGLESGRLGPGRYAIETKAGSLAVEVSEDGLVFMSQTLPVFGPQVAPALLAAALPGTRVLDARVVSTGLPDLLVEVADRRALAALMPNPPEIEAVTRDHGAVSVHVFAPGEGPVDAFCRDFAPGVGIDEEAATGTASGALACHLVERGRAGGDLVFVQGESLGRPSEILAKVEARGRRVERVRVGGRARLEKTAAI